MSEPNEFYPHHLLEKIRFLFKRDEFTVWLKSLLEEDEEGDSYLNDTNIPLGADSGWVLPPSMIRMIVQLLGSAYGEADEKYDARIVVRYQALSRNQAATLLDLIKDDWPPVIFSPGGEPFAAHPDDPKYQSYQTAISAMGPEGYKYFELVYGQLRLLQKIDPKVSIDVITNHMTLMSATEHATNKLSDKSAKNRERGWMTAKDPSAEELEIASNVYKKLSLEKVSVGWKSLQTGCLEMAKARGIPREQAKAAFTEHACNKLLDALKP